MLTGGACRTLPLLAVGDAMRGFNLAFIFEIILAKLACQTLPLVTVFDTFRYLRRAQGIRQSQLPFCTLVTCPGGDMFNTIVNIWHTYVFIRSKRVMILTCEALPCCLVLGCTLFDFLYTPIEVSFVFVDCDVLLDACLAVAVRKLFKAVVNFGHANETAVSRNLVTIFAKVAIAVVMVIVAMLDD